MCQIVSEYRNRRVASPEARIAGLGRRDFLALAGTAAVALAAGPAWAQTAKVEVHWLGQAATKLTTLDRQGHRHRSVHHQQPQDAARTRRTSTRSAR